MGEGERPRVGVGARVCSLLGPVHSGLMAGPTKRFSTVCACAFKSCVSLAGRKSRAKDTLLTGGDKLVLCVRKLSK